MAILSRRGVRPEMEFACCECGDKYTGQEVLDGERLHVVRVDREKPERSLFRCECCQDDWEDARCDAEG